MFAGSGGLVLLGVVLGGVVRLLRTEKFNDVLKKFGLKPVPSWSLPWLSVGLGAAAQVTEAVVGGSALSAALPAAVDGVLAGALAVAGHETIARTPARRAAAKPLATDGSETLLPPAPPTSME